MFTTIIGFMRRIAGAIRGLFMKASRFIINTDYATTQNDSEITITLTIPGVFTIPRTQTKIWRTTVSAPGSASKGYRCYFTSTKYNYAITGCTEAKLKINGNTQYNDFFISVSRKNDQFELAVHSLADISDRSFNDQAQVITAHIQTFVDPFQA